MQAILFIGAKIVKKQLSINTKEKGTKAWSEQTTVMKMIQQRKVKNIWINCCKNITTLTAKTSSVMANSKPDSHTSKSPKKTMA